MGINQRLSSAKSRSVAQLIVLDSKGHAVIRFGSGWIVAGIIAFLLIGAGYIGATAYVFFRDDILSAAIDRTVRLQHAYEDRIAALRSQIDRINSRQLIDQEAFEAKIATLMARQDILKENEAKVGAVLERARQHGLKLPPINAGGAPLPDQMDAPKRQASWFDSVLPAPPTRAVRAENRIAGAARSVESLAERQSLAVVALAELAERDTKTIERVVGKLGLRLADEERPAGSEALPRSKPKDGMGGPLVPVVDASALFARADAAIERFGRVRRTIGLLPLGAPIKGDPQVTSGFGTRNDPFLGSLAMHTGLDFRAETGDPVVATGSGVVTDAGRQGGYGNMIEIDHGNGISTRFGHLSRIGVEVGARVKPGDVIGFAGSTGRSTGPHLHYETRINGDPVNPSGWVEAGEQLGPVLR